MLERQKKYALVNIRKRVIRRTSTQNLHQVPTSTDLLHCHYVIRYVLPQNDVKTQHHDGKYNEASHKLISI